MKKIFISIVVIVAFAISFYPIKSNSNVSGSVGGKTGSPADGVSCTQCHGVNSSGGGVASITTDIPATGYVPGNTYTITATISPIASFGVNGFELTSEQDATNLKIGDFILTSANATQLVNNGNSVTHTAGGSALNSWSVDWEAPSVGSGDVTFYAAFIEAGYPIGSNFTDYFSDYDLTVSEYIDSCIVEINNGTVDIEICDGDTAILEATSGFDTYLWTSTASSGAVLGTTHVLNATVSGLYTVVVTDGTTCVDMDSIEVVVYPTIPLNPATVPNPPEICLGDSLVIEVDTGFVDYWWNTNNPSDQGQDRVVVYPTQDFIYVVEALDTNGCESREEIQVYVDTCATSIINSQRDNIRIYPNPVYEGFSIKLDNHNLYNIELIDNMGRVVLRKEGVNDLVSIKTSQFLNGVYFVVIQGSDFNVTTFKIVLDN